jgi:transposase
MRVEILVQARRFFCDVGGCRRRVYCERFPGVLEPYSRWTERARKALLEMSHASSAESVARIARMMGFKVSHDSLLRLQGREVFSFRHAPYIAVDEFAWRKRQRYGTLIVDLERRLPVALLPTDTAEGLSAWLRLNGPIAVMARDRDHTFANAAKLDAPGAVQVADRFHLVSNVMESFRKVIHARRWRARRAIRAVYVIRRRGNSSRGTR